MSQIVAIRLENLSKVYGRRKRVRALHRLNLEVHSGQVYGFLGPNGAGKTTTIRLLLDLIRPTEGAAYIYGQHVRREHSVLRRVGAMVEGAAFYPFLSARRNLEVLARNANCYDAERIERLLEQVGLAEVAKRRVKGFSSGMKQRLGLAAALLTDPDLLILDEPTSGLDPGGIHEVREFLRRLVDEEGKTVFLSSHLLSEVEQVCDRVAIINQGEIVREGAVAELLSAHHRLRVEATPPQKAAALLGEHWLVMSVDGALLVEVPHEDVPHVVRALVQGGCDVFAVTPQRQTLEEYFLAVVREATQSAGRQV